MNDIEQIKFKAKRIDSDVWVSGHYFTSPLTQENSGVSSDKGWFFLCGEKRHCIEQDHVVFIVDPLTIKRDCGIDDEGRYFGPFSFPESQDRIYAISKYLLKLPVDEYNRLPLSMRQALEFLYDCMKVEVSETAKQDACAQLCEVMTKINEVSFKIDYNCEVIIVDDVKKILSHYFV